MKNIDNENVFNFKQAPVKKKPLNSEVKSDAKSEQIAQNTLCNQNSISEVIGRSQVNYTFKKDLVADDVKQFVEHPKCIANTNKFFELAFQKNQDVQHPYEYSTVLAKAYYDMLQGNFKS